VPWQMLCEEKNAQLKVIPMNDEGELILSEFDKLLTSKTKIVAVNHISNSLGTINPIEEIMSKAHSNGTVVLIDGAQAVSHMPLNMVELDADFYVFSAHKLFGPTGAGILYGKEDLMNNMPPYQGGGDMIKTVTFEKTTYNDLPHKMEAGTPNIVGGIATAAGIEYIQSIGFEAIVQKENELKEAATKMLLSIPGLKIYGEASNKISVISFMIKGLHPYDVGTILDQLGIAIRTGHHCTQPVMDFFDIPGTIRASFSFYNDQSDIDALEKGLLKAISMLN
jgi:cysteine desulfurase/selenocysteine lyase